MDLGDLAERRGAPGADCPDRFVGDHRVGARRRVRDGARKLRADDIERASRVAVIARLSQADDGDKARGQRRLGLGADQRVGFAVIGAAFGMAEDHMACARVAQHRGRNVACMRARGGAVAILAAKMDGRATHCLGHAGQKRGGRADQDVAGGRRPGLCQGADLGQACAGAVHLPVSGRQFPPHPSLRHCSSRKASRARLQASAGSSSAACGSRQ